MSTILSAYAARAGRALAAASRTNWSSGIAKAVASVLVFGALLCASQPASAQFTQQGPKLVGGGATKQSEQGNSVAVSADGNTAIIGGPADDNTGAAWVFTRSNGVWTQQGSKLVGTGAVGYAEQGFSVALSADGNTAILGGPSDNPNSGVGVGAAWVFTRSDGVWTQQGSKLVGTGALVRAYQGWSVALSGDGNTAILGGPSDNSKPGVPGVGAAWVFTRSGGVWTQQGSKLVGTGEVGTFGANQGFSVALSADGDTAIVGGYLDNFYIGAAWVFTRSGRVWTQQGSKLVGTGVVGKYSSQGDSVALSADGNTAIVGGWRDNTNAGAAWVFTRSGTTWSQQQKLVGTGAVNKPYSAQQGNSVALSGDGNAAIVGGPNDNVATGAAWVFTRSGSTWTQQGSKLVGTGAAGDASQGYSVALSADGNTAIVGGVRDNTNAGAAWVFATPGTGCSQTATHDFNGDCKSDILWRNTGGELEIWLMDGSKVLQKGDIGTMPTTTWSVIGQRDFNGGGDADILWQNTSGDLEIWFMNGLKVASKANIASKAPTNASLYGTGDLNGDGKGDLLWRNSKTGAVTAWFMNGSKVTGTANLGSKPPNWTIVASDAHGDIFWRDTAGDLEMWQVHGSKVVAKSLGTVVKNWAIAGVGDFNGDGNIDILWRCTVTGAGFAQPATWRSG